MGGLVTLTPDNHLPALFGGPFHVQRATVGVGFCPLDRAVGVDLELSNRDGMRLGVLVPQHQTPNGCV